MKKLIPIIVAIVLVIGGGAFYGGMKYGQNKTPAANFQRFQQTGVPGTGSSAGRVGNQTGGGFVTGEIISKDDKSVTVKLQNGGSKIIFYSDTTEIGKLVNGAVNDLEVGKSVVINGKANQDGSITADSIQLRLAITSTP